MQTQCCLCFLQHFKLSYIYLASCNVSLGFLIRLEFRFIDLASVCDTIFTDWLIFQIPVTYPSTAIEIALPELDGKTAKMYRGGKICLTDHFKPLWARNVPRFGIAHAFALGVSSTAPLTFPYSVRTKVLAKVQAMSVDLEAQLNICWLYE